MTMKCPVCNKEINRPLHITKTKDEAHKSYVQSQFELAESMLKSDIPLVDIQNDDRIVIKSAVTDYLHLNYKDLLLELSKNNKNKKISNSLKREDSLRNQMRKKLKTLIEQGKENEDYVECKICGLKSTNLSSHVTRIHKLSAKQYKEQFTGAELFSKKIRDKFRDKMLTNNPNDDPKSIAKMKETKASTREERIRKAKEQFARGERKPSQNVGRGINGLRGDLGHSLRSIWEANVARVLRLKNIEYGYEIKAFPFYDENNEIFGSYLPDFYLPQFSVWIEVKGQMDSLSKLKIELFKEFYPNENLFIVDGKVYDNIMKAFKPKLGKKYEYQKRNIKTHPELYKGEK